MLRRTWVAMAALVAAIPALAAVPAHPGMLNYVEGQASIGSQDLNSSSVGSASLRAGQTLETGNGKVELLLTPGIFLRVNNGSAVTLLSANLTDTRVEVLRGQAMLEADDLHQENNLRVVNDGAVTTIDKNGLYRFDADRRLVAVYDGKATVQDNDKSVDVKGGRAVSLDAVPIKAKKFDKKSSEDELYSWSKLRSEYLAEANAASAPTLVVNNGWYGPGWYWNPWYSSYTFVPGGGFLYSPFGFGFGSPWAFGGYYGGFYPGHYGRRPVIVGRAPVRGTRPVAPNRGLSARGRVGSVSAPRPGIASGMGRGGFAPGLGGRGAFGGRR